MSTRTQHIWEFIETLLGPIVFVVYFGLSYLLSSVGCTLAADMAFAPVINATAIAAVLVILTLAAFLALALVAGAAARRLSDPGSHSDEEDTFLAYLTVTLALLSAVGVMWIAIAASSMPTCASFDA